MAGDWVKIEKATSRKPEVLRMSTILGIHPDHALGMCVRFWAWCDDQLSDCHAIGVTSVTIDSVVGHSGFGEAMRQVGWLESDDSGLVIPHFEYHLSKSAKKRAEDSKRQAEHRKSKTAMSQKPCDNSVTNQGPEKRREDLASLSANTGLDEVRIPDKLNTPECQQAAQLWFEYLEVNGLQYKNPKHNGLNLQTWWNQMARHSAEDFCLAVPDSIARRRWDVTFDKIGGSDGHKKRNGHSKYSKDLMKVVKVCKEHQGGDKWQIREQHMGPELTKAMKASGGSGEVLAASADDFKLQTFSEIFEMHLADIRKAGNGSTTSH